MSSLPRYKINGWKRFNLIEYFKVQQIQTTYF